MSKLILVTRKSDNKKMYVNTANICVVRPHPWDETATIIQFSGSDENYIEVLESSDTVANMMEG